MTLEVTFRIMADIKTMVTSLNMDISDAGTINLHEGDSAI